MDLGAAFPERNLEEENNPAVKLLLSILLSYFWPLSPFSSVFVSFLCVQSLEKGSQAGWRQRTERQLDLTTSHEGYEDLEEKEEEGRWPTRSPCCPVHGLSGDVWELPFQVGIFPVPSTSMVCNPEIAYGWA